MSNVFVFVFCIWQHIIRSISSNSSSNHNGWWEKFKHQIYYWIHLIAIYPAGSWCVRHECAVILSKGNMRREEGSQWSYTIFPIFQFVFWRANELTCLMQYTDFWQYEVCSSPPKNLLDLCGWTSFPGPTSTSLYCHLNLGFMIIS